MNVLSSGATPRSGAQSSAPALAAFSLPFAEISLSSSSPRFSPEQASKILSLRNVGLAQLEEDRPKEARATFAKLAGLVPGEALPLADGAVAALRDKDLAGAEALLAKVGRPSGRLGDPRGARERAQPAGRDARRPREGGGSRPARPRVALAIRAQRRSGPFGRRGREGAPADVPRGDRRALAFEPAGAAEAAPHRSRGRRPGGRAEDARRSRAARFGRRRAGPEIPRRGEGRARRRRPQGGLRQGPDPRERRARDAALPAVARGDLRPGRRAARREIFAEGGRGAARGRGAVDPGHVSGAGCVRRERREIAEKGGPRELRHAFVVPGSGAFRFGRLFRLRPRRATSTSTSSAEASPTSFSATTSTAPSRT